LPDLKMPLTRFALLQKTCLNNKTNYELAYTIIEGNGKTVVVILAGTRENFYNELKQYIKGISM
jgi:DNA-binding HxlR family transcriptional regulator